MYVNKSELDVKMKLQEVQVVKVDRFKYLGSTIQSNGRSVKQGETCQSALFNGNC